MIRIEAAWLAAAPMDMRAGTDTVLAGLVTVFGTAHPTTPTYSPTSEPTV